MNKAVFGFMSLLLFSVTEEKERSGRFDFENSFISSAAIKFDTLTIDPIKSKIVWKGTKMMGLGSHEGDIAIQNGFLLFQNQELSGGEIKVNMREIKVTDIPATDPIPIKNLTDHLKSPDFFDVDKYPFSVLYFRSIEKLQNNKLGITASLIIKGTSNFVHFEAEKVSNNHFQAYLQIDRFEWDIAYRGSWVDRTLVDQEIDLSVEIVCN
ncbi:YceI family protein [Algoriphagus sp.]|uniref:YceI family protein n=1 Tax=Algoriphagus sp. TaxID=1872435 RepID=UPI00260157C3|nr:YceI family protein [Algoriphagus sp.]